MSVPCQEKPPQRTPQPPQATYVVTSDASGKFEFANVDPGARFARADGATKEEAELRAIEKATKYLAQTRRFKPEV